MKVIFDNNIWISYAIGNHLEDIPSILLRPEIELFACTELFEEFERVCKYPKLQKLLNPKRIQASVELMYAKTSLVSIEHQEADFSDPKDNYLLNLSRTVEADYLVTGDKRLLALKNYDQTQIITYRSFCDLLDIS